MASPPNEKGSTRKRFGNAFRREYDRFIDAIRPASPISQHPDSGLDPPTGARPVLPPPRTAGLRINAHSNPTHAELIDGKGVIGTPETTRSDAARSTTTVNSAPSPASRIETENVALSGIGVALRTLEASANVFPLLKDALGGFITCLDIVEAAATNAGDYEQLTSELTTMAISLNKYVAEFDAGDSDGNIERIARQVSIEAEDIRIQKRSSRSMGKRLVESTQDKEDVINSYRKIEGLFRQLQNDVNLQTLKNTHKILLERMTRLLQGISPVDDARYNSTYSTTIKRRACTPQTRKQVQSDLQSWIRDPHGAKVYWMNGMAGTGKTTIAYSLCEWLENENLLAASFFCSRASSSCRNVNLIVPTIAYQLARHFSGFQSTLCKELEADPDVGKLNVVRQFERLVRDPLTNSKDKALDGAVVVIDALDECEDDYGVRLIVGTLLKLAANLPLRFFVTSRPEPAIQDSMLHPGGYSPATLHLHDIEKSVVEGDIKTFLHTELEFVSLAPSKIDQLAERAGNLFIYAATAVRYIMSRRGDPASRLDAMLAIDSQSTNTDQYSKKYKELDALYTAVLEAALMDEELEQVEVEHMRLVLWTVICAQEPLAIPALASLADLTEGQVSSSLKPLYSVLHVSKSRGVVSTLHASFPNYMLDRRRSQDLHCDESQHNAFLALRCFWIMEQKLRFNICGLESSFEWDRDVPDLEQRVEAHIPLILLYSCQYWGEHLCRSSALDELSTKVEEFLTCRLLFWMEVLNVKQLIAKGAVALNNAEKWLLIQSAPAALKKEAMDARDFVTRFAAGTCSRSTPHIYISALPFCAKSSSVYANYWGHTRGLMDVRGTAIGQRDGAAQATWTTNSGALSAAFSPDGTRIATGCADADIWVWEAHTGDVIVGPLNEHARSANSIAFSPDSTRLVSGSSDSTIRFWDIRTGNTLAGPFEGHSNSVNSVAYSPDGTRIVSGSEDETILLWDAGTGNIVSGPLRGHTNAVNSVGFSPNGAYIVSGSADKTIRVWSTYTGDLAFEPLAGHSDSVTSIAFSPDGSYIASGSADRSIRVWDARTGNLITGPLKSHMGVVNSVAFSPDGTRIVSGSNDETPLVWDTHTGRIVAGPFRGHTGVVQSVAFSPDGAHIVTGSLDSTVRVWDMHLRETAEGSSMGGHSHWVASIAFSSNGALIVSGSYDKTVRVWDTLTGNPTVRPLEGHADYVRSVAFSPNSTHVVSGSDDETVRVWDISTGDYIVGTLEGPSGGVNCVAFSPDGTRLVSGSNDKAIRVWDASNGYIIAGPLKGHTDSVRSVAFSPDGMHIVSGSHDAVIRVWDACTGDMIVALFGGSIGPVRSVVFSLDGGRIVSCSEGGDVRIWNTHTGNLVEGPFKGYTGAVNSAMFVPGSVRIVSSHGFDDHGVLVWDTHTGGVFAGPFDGHTDVINSVAFSPDGTCVASASDDQAIRVSHCRPRNVTNIPYFKLLQPTTTTSRETETIPESSSQASSDAQSTTSPSVLPSPASHDHRPKETLYSVDFKCHKDGWVTSDGVRLFWTPPDLRAHIPFPQNRVVIGHQGSMSINYENLLLGERWIECFKS